MGAEQGWAQDAGSLSLSHTHTAINTCVAWGLEESERSLVLLSSSLPVGHVPANLVYR